MSYTFKTAAVFGVFDGLHAGHQFLLREALNSAEQLIVIVALDQTVQLLKGHQPKYTFLERKEALEKFDPRILTQPGDEMMGSWTVLKKFQPEIVFLGYDQQALAEELQKIGQAVQILPAHFPNQYKSSLLNN